MANLTVVRFTEDDLDLASITTTVQQGETRLGPLLAISSCEDFPPKRLTCFTHEQTSAPSQAIELRLCPGGVIPTISGKTLVCIGNCFVQAELRMVAAFR
jgi:hypothetical protein